MCPRGAGPGGGLFAIAMFQKSAPNGMCVGCHTLVSTAYSSSGSGLPRVARPRTSAIQQTNVRHRTTLALGLPTTTAPLPMTPSSRPPSYGQTVLQMPIARGRRCACRAKATPTSVGAIPAVCVHFPVPQIPRFAPSSRSVPPALRRERIKRCAFGVAKRDRVALRRPAAAPRRRRLVSPLQTAREHSAAGSAFRTESAPLRAAT